MNTPPREQSPDTNTDQDSGQQRNHSSRQGDSWLTPQCLDPSPARQELFSQPLRTSLSGQTSVNQSATDTQGLTPPAILADLNRLATSLGVSANIHTTAVRLTKQLSEQHPESQLPGLPAGALLVSSYVHAAPLDQQRVAAAARPAKAAVMDSLDRVTAATDLSLCVPAVLTHIEEFGSALDLPEDTIEAVKQEAKADAGTLVTCGCKPKSLAATYLSCSETLQNLPDRPRQQDIAEVADVNTWTITQQARRLGKR